MTINLTKTIILFFLLFGCNSSNTTNNQRTIPDSEHLIKNSPNILKSDSTLFTGFYFIKDTVAAYKRQLIKTNEIYSIDPTPIVTAKNFEKVTMFHEKDCYALFIWLDKKGSQLLNIAMKNYKGRKFALIVDNQLVRIQLVDDPQFATVDNNEDPRIYGQVLAFPCNSFSPAELTNYETMIKNEK